MDITTILGIGRIAERLIIVIISGLSIYMGFKLFAINSAKSIAAGEEAEFSYKTFLLKLKNVGPGIFFSLFGSAIIITSLINPLNIHETKENPNSKDSSLNNYNVKYLSEYEKKDLRRWIIALNMVTSIVNLPQEQTIPSPDRFLLKKNATITVELRNYLLGLYFTPQKRDTWLRWKDVLAMNPNEVPSDLLEITSAVDRLGSLTIDEGSLNE